MGLESRKRSKCGITGRILKIHSRQLYVETQLAPTLLKGDVVILDNLSSHKSPRAAEVLHDVGAWFLFLPPYSPDLNPTSRDIACAMPCRPMIKMAFSKLKALIRKAAARTCEDIQSAVGHVCNLLSDKECFNVFKAAGYRTD